MPGQSREESNIKMFISSWHSNMDAHQCSSHVVKPIYMRLVQHTGDIEWALLPFPRLSFKAYIDICLRTFHVMHDPVVYDLCDDAGLKPTRWRQLFHNTTWGKNVLMCLFT